MTTEECLEHIPLFGKFDLGSFYGRNPTDAQKLFVLNWAVRLIGKYLRIYDPALELTLSEEFIQNLRDPNVCEREVVELYGVIINGSKLTGQRGQPGVWTLAQLEKFDPAWMTRDADVPSIAAFHNGKLYLYRKPTQAVVDAGDNYAMAVVLPRERTNDEDDETGLSTEPDIPKELHEAACFLAATKSGLPQVSEPDAWKRLEAFSGEWTGIAAEIRLQNSHDLIEIDAEPVYDEIR